jgi:NADH-quinone oxidoreductase subunit M
MVNHGLSTGALFLCVGMLYERFHTREMARFGGLAKVMPLWSSFMVFFCLASVGLPGLNGFVGEFLTLLGAFLAKGVLGPGYAAVAGVGMILGAVYLLHLLGRVVWGPTRVPAAHHGSDDHSSGHPTGHSAEHPAVQDLNTREVAVLLPLAAACLLLGLFPAAMLKSIDGPVRRLTAPAAAVLAGREAPPSPTGSLGAPLGAPLASRDGKDGPAR